MNKQEVFVDMKLVHLMGENGSQSDTVGRQYIEPLISTLSIVLEAVTSNVSRNQNIIEALKLAMGF